MCSGHKLAPLPPVHVVISTHTTRHLRRTLLGLAAQHRRPDSVVVSCDNDDAAISDLVRVTLSESGLEGAVIQRPHAGVARLNQVRNNGLRWLHRHAPSESVVVILDGDCVLRSDALQHHAACCRPRTLVIAFRHDLTEPQTAGFDDEALARREPPVALPNDQLQRLAARARRYRRQAMLRRFGLTKPHKPKPLGAHMSFRLADAVAINGFDERYEGYGQDDDDFGRRMYQSGCAPVVAIDRIIAYHLYHPTRAPADWHGSPNARLFASASPVRCEFGMDNPRPQIEPRTFTIEPIGSPTEARTAPSATG